MLIFVILMILILLLSRIRFVKTKPGIGQENAAVGNASPGSLRNPESFWMLCVCCILVLGLRSQYMGIDTIDYYREFLSMDLDTLPKLGLFSECAYPLLCISLRKLGLGFQVFLMLEAIVAVFPVFWVISKYSRNPFFSVFFYVAMDYYLFSATGIRQAFAIGLLMLAFECSQRRTLIPYLIFVLLATLFHRTALIFLPVYFLKLIPFRKITAVISVGIGVVAYVFRGVIRPVFAQYARINYSKMETGGTGMLLFLLFPIVVWFFYDKHSFKEKQSCSIFFLMNIVAVILFPILQYNPTILRLSYYYSIMVIFTIPEALSQINDSTMRLLISVPPSVAALYYYFSYTVRNMGVLPFDFFVKS